MAPDLAQSPLQDGGKKSKSTVTAATWAGARQKKRGIVVVKSAGIKQISRRQQGTQQVSNRKTAFRIYPHAACAKTPQRSLTTASTTTRTRPRPRPTHSKWSLARASAACCGVCRPLPPGAPLARSRKPSASDMLGPPESKYIKQRCMHTNARFSPANAEKIN